MILERDVSEFVEIENFHGEWVTYMHANNHILYTQAISWNKSMWSKFRLDAEEVPDPSCCGYIGACLDRTVHVV